MKIRHRRFLHLAAGAAALSSAPRIAWARTYPVAVGTFDRCFRTWWGD